jgi:hypothetical protein
MSKMPKSKRSLLMTGAAMTSALVLPFAVSATTTSAQTGETPPWKTVTKMNRYPLKQLASTPIRTPHISGTVSAISGSTLTVTNATGTVYTVDASSAKVMEGLFVSGLSVSDIRVGDKILIRGTVNGTSVTAKSISDPSFIGRNIFTGTVASISGTTITITSKQAATSTVDATSATITSGVFNKKTIPVSDVNVGDRLTIIGSTSGSTITATVIQDLGKMHKATHFKKGLGHKPGKTGK